MYITQEGPANALALNKENTQVVIAGRNVFKVFNIEETEFVENCNLRVGKNLNLNFSCNDVEWNTIDDGLLATAATNGAVVLWNLGRHTRSKQEHVFNDHKRTVNKVCFHGTEPSLLLSGSQDGTMKCFDLRTRQVLKTFYSNSESVRDVQFSPHHQHLFSSVSENGNVQLWDLRRSDKHYLQFTAHSGPVFACDWHPEMQWLATASRDKTIKVWDLSTKTQTMEFVIHTIASIGHIKWRPQRRFHIASCALVVDCSINIWDVRRPYIPFASFDQHKDVPTGVVWRGQPAVFLSTSRDCTLYQHAFRDALRPANNANPQGISLNYLGDIMYAARTNPSASTSKKFPPILKKQLSHSEKFCHATSVLRLFLSKNRKQSNWFEAMAKQYLLVGKTLAELCEHNASVAEKLGRHQIALIWNIVKTLYSYQCLGKRSTDHGLLSTTSKRTDEFIHSSDGKSFNGTKMILTTCPSGFDSDSKSIKPSEDSTAGLEEEPEAEETLDSQYGIITNLMSKSVSGIQNEFQVQGDFFFGDGELDPLSAVEQSSNVLPQEPDWTIQSEAFPIRHEIQEGSPQQEQFPHHRTLDNELDSSSLTVEQVPHSQVVVNFLPTITRMDPSRVMVDALKHHANMGDVQTAVSILFVLGEKRKELEGLDMVTQEHWLLTYLDLLARYRLWDVSAYVIQLCWIPSINQLNQQSTTMYTCCGECSKPLQRSGWLCDRCHNSAASSCSVCHQIVRGLYAWCQGCGHGGHLFHFIKWFKTNKECPSGCGHHCEYG
ncbi:hypothetical protein RUM43_005430 [Polyplax serrata]|uniref:GATOR2 complex protein WDR24 n=1 Tax=Polyplax serrata TaxID=468196 RepID=A0AAN8PDI8_POLSC